MNQGINRRSININGKVTSIALEPVFWQELDNRAKEAGVSWAEYSRRLIEDIGEVKNRASALKQHLMQTIPRPAKSLLVEVIDQNRRVRLRCQGPRVFIGRNADNQIVLDDPKVSRVHALLVSIGEKWWVGDLQSKNGTRIGRKKVVFQPIQADKVLRIGKYQLQIVQ